MKKIVAVGSFDDLRSRHVRFLHEASRLGDLHVLLWTDDVVRSLDGKEPKFPLEERLYLLQAIRYVQQITPVGGLVGADELPNLVEIPSDIWAVDERSDNATKRSNCKDYGLAYHVLRDEDLAGFPTTRSDVEQEEPLSKKVIVTGCFDWLHSGHVRFFEEVSQLGDLYVVVGHDKNVRLLKGEDHPMFSQDERRYMVQSIRTVKQALISSGHGWMDAEPEIARIKPDIYAVNEDGDKPEKRAFCSRHRIDYVVLNRRPKEGLSKRESTALRGF